jgi:hypothetical protein
MADLRSEIAANAARLVVEDGMDYGSAKRRAARDIGVSDKPLLPDNQQLEQAVREYLALFLGDSQPQELLALRRLALRWMDRLAEFRPHVCGAVWNGTATARSPIHLELFCDDAKMAELALVNLGARLEATSSRSADTGADTTFHLVERSGAPGSPVDILIDILDYDRIRGGLRGDRFGRVARGDAAQLRARIVEGGHA